MVIVSNIPGETSNEYVEQLVFNIMINIVIYRNMIYQIRSKLVAFLGYIN